MDRFGTAGRRAGWLRLAAVAAAVLMSAAPATAAGIADIEYDNAVRSFRAGRTSDAYGQFIELASRGDVDAARIALFMHAYGATLYGKHWDAGDQDVAYWKVLVRNSGTSARPVAEFQPTLLTPQKQKPKVASGKGARAASLKNVAVSGN